jgi:hypothetical protein
MLDSIKFNSINDAGTIELASWLVNRRFRVRISMRPNFVVVYITFHLFTFHEMMSRDTTHSEGIHQFPIAKMPSTNLG